MRAFFGLSTFLFFILDLYLSHAQIRIPVQRRSSSLDLKPIKELEKGLFGKDNQHSTIMNQFVNITQPLSNYQNVQYFGEIIVGSQNETFTVVFDTGSDILWIPAADCATCHQSLGFNCKESVSCVELPSPDQRIYGTGSVAGYDVADMVGLTPDSMVKYKFMLAQSDEGLGGLGADGILGLSNDNTQQNFVDLAYEAGYIADKVFSFSLDFNPLYNVGAKTNISYMNIGFIPPNHVNSLVWLPVTARSYWSTDVIAMKVNGQEVDFGSDSDITSVLFDTGTSYILLASPVYTAVEQELAANGCIVYGSLICPCEESYMKNYPNITFYTRGLVFNVTPEQYLINPSYLFHGSPLYCTPALQNTYNTQSGETVGQQILGDAFFRHNFISFSKRNQSIALNAQNMEVLFPVFDGPSFWTGLTCVLLMILALVFVNYRQNKFKLWDDQQSNHTYLMSDY